MKSSEDTQQPLEIEPEAEGLPILDVRRDFTPTPPYLAHVLQFVLLFYSWGLHEKYKEALRCNKAFSQNKIPNGVATFELQKNNPNIQIVAHYSPLPRTLLLFYLDQYHHFRHIFERAESQQELLYALDLLLEYTVLVSNELLEMYKSAESKQFGFDDVRYAELLRPSLTTIHQPCVDIGTIAMQVMLERIENPAFPPRDILAQPTLIVRQSSGA